MLFREPAFKERAGVDAGRRMTLYIKQITAVVFGGCMPKMIEADAQHIGQRRKAGNMTTKIAVSAIGLDHHRHRIPAHIRTQPFFQLQIARAMLTEMGGNGVDVSSVTRERDMRTAAARQVHHALKQIMRALRAFVVQHCFERVEPLLGFHHIRVIGGLRQNYVDLR